MAVLNLRHLPAGHYEGRWSCNAHVESWIVDEDGVPHLVAPARMTFVMPGHGVLVAHAVNYQTGICDGTRTTFTQEWRYSSLSGTGVFSGLTDKSGNAVAVAVRPCPVQ